MRLSAVRLASDHESSAEDGDFRLLNSVGETRSQLVWILSSTNSSGTIEIREIWPVGYPSNEPLLRMDRKQTAEGHAKVKVDGWQAKRWNGKHAAVFSAQIAADTEKLPPLLALRAVTTIADEMEAELVRRDDH